MPDDWQCAPMKIIKNPWRHAPLPAAITEIQGTVRSDPAGVFTLLARCPAAHKTPLVECAPLAQALGIARLTIKDERGRMGLGSFKALGAAYAIAKEAHKRLGDKLFGEGAAKTALVGKTYVAATAGNHGLSIAAGARVFGAKAVIYIAQTVDESFATQLRSFGAEVVREGAEYAASLAAAERAAQANGWQLLSDTSWPGYTELPLDVMEGYLVMASEAATDIEAAKWQPTHIFLQAGVGGLAAAVCAHLRTRWGDGPTIIVVEPDAAPALQASIEAGKPLITIGPISNMGRLDCKEPSHLALKLLAQGADFFQTISDAYTEQAIAELADHALATSPSGGAGYAGLKAALADGSLGLTPDSQVLLFLSEGPIGG
jgi:diaminopropionate ammonia-lyase